MINSDASTTNLCDSEASISTNLYCDSEYLLVYLLVYFSNEQQTN